MCDVLFITPNLSSSVMFEVNGTMILGTLLLEDGFDVKILRFSQIDGFNKDYSLFIENFINKILAHQPKCVSFYTVWTEYHIVLRLCQELKKRDSSIHLIVGGPQGSALAMETLRRFPSVDYVCTGEGEHTVLPFFRRLLRSEGVDFSQIPGLYFRKDGQIQCNTSLIPLCDVNSVPFWDERLLMEEYTGAEERLDPRHYYMPVEVGRGCPYNCTFCSTSPFWRRTYRLKRPERIIQDIRYFQNRFGYQSFLLAHDALTANGKLTEALCDKILEEGLDINWECSTRIDCLTPELLAKMKASGLKRLHMGIETGSERMQKIISKNLDLSQVKGMVKELLSLDLYFAFFFVQGVPEETEEDFSQTLELIFDLCDMGAPDLQLIMCLFTPGSALTERYYDQLVFEPSLQAVAMSKFGCVEESDMIRDNKPLFTSFYHFHSPVRDNYPFAKYLSLLYQRFPRTARFVRQLYQGDNLKFCEDFHNNNPELLSMKLSDLEVALFRDPLKIMLNTIRDINVPAAAQVRELLRYERDLARMKFAPVGTQELNTYGFRYYEYKMGCNAHQLTDGTSRILLRKEKEKVSVQLAGLT